MRWGVRWDILPEGIRKATPLVKRRENPSSETQFCGDSLSEENTHKKIFVHS